MYAQELTFFQFQYGTIKRQHRSRQCLQYNAFQFQYGTIKSKRPSQALNPTDDFQFQYGTIKRNQGRIDVAIILLSIPVWYD